jgi:hypothetical protein
MRPLERISEMLRLANTKDRIFPATIFYNEGWLLRLVLDWFSRQHLDGHLLNFAIDARWYSEALLPSQFFARQRPDNLAEGWTHADGVIGHLQIGQEALANTRLADNAKRMIRAISGFRQRRATLMIFSNSPGLSLRSRR